MRAWIDPVSYHESPRPVTLGACFASASPTLMGHMSRAMLERYSHIRMAAKRDAVAGVALHPKIAAKAEQAENSEEVPVKVPVVEPATLIQ